MAADRHTIVLRFAPPVPEKADEKGKPQLVVLDGWHATSNGGGHVIARGIIIVPEKK
jgi:hypothetical protein